jgi:hypothetical protein
MLMESIYALTLLPASAYTAVFLAHEIARYIGLQQHGAAPHPFLWGLYCILNICLPHLLLAYMAKVQQRHGALQHSSMAMGKAGHQGPRAAGGQVPTEGQPAPQGNQVSGAASTAQADRLEAKQKEAEQDLAAIQRAQQQQTQTQRQQHDQQVAGQVARPGPVRQEALQSLMNARKMVQRGSAPRTYTSRVPSSQVCASPCQYRSRQGHVTARHHSDQHEPGWQPCSLNHPSTWPATSTGVSCLVKHQHNHPSAGVPHTNAVLHMCAAPSTVLSAGVVRFTQVVIKLQDTEPEQLLDVVRSTAAALRSSG